MVVHHNVVDNMAAVLGGCQRIVEDRHEAQIPVEIALAQQIFRNRQQVAQTVTDKIVEILDRMNVLFEADHDGDYDCLVAFSGGKDSSYILWWLTVDRGLRCLAITIDNGFIAKQAVENCRTITDALGVDHVFYKPAFGFMRRMYTESIKGGLQVGAAVKRASAICNSCITLINNHMVKTALQANIPIIAGGYLGGQVPRNAAMMDLNLDGLRKARKTSVARQIERFGEEAKRYFSLDVDDASDGRRLTVVNPMLVLNVGEAEIVSRLETFGWRRPRDTGTHSSNCLLNDLGIFSHVKQHGFHPYVAELAEQVRLGLMSRADALARVESVPTGDAVAASAEKLGIDLSSL